MEQPIEKDAYTYAAERLAYYRERYGGIAAIEENAASEEALFFD